MAAHRELPQGDPAEVGLCPDRTRALVQVFQREVDRGRLPGAVLMLGRRGRVVLHEAVGRLAPGGPAMAPDALFRIYSMTKPMVSVAALMLVEQGHLSLADPVARHLPAFAHTPVLLETPEGVQLQAPVRPPTVQDLLRHTAGLTYEFLGASKVQRLYAEANIGSRQRSNAEFAEALAAIPLFCQPGSRWAYSRATDLLGCVIEAVTGQTLGRHLQQVLFDPLGLHDTAFAVPAGEHGRIAEPFAQDPDGGINMRLFDPRTAPALESGGGGLVSTARDYARFLQCLAGGGELDGVRLLGPQTLRFAMADHLGPIRAEANDALLPPGHGFGLTMAVRTAAGEALMPGSVGTNHWSGIGGTSFFIDPAQDTWGIFLAQAPNQREEYRLLFRTLAYAALTD